MIVQGFGFGILELGILELGTHIIQKSERKNIRAD
jgi:hypothetical protein